MFCKLIWIIVLGSWVVNFWEESGIGWKIGWVSKGFRKGVWLVGYLVYVLGFSVKEIRGECGLMLFVY